MRDKIFKEVMEWYKVQEKNPDIGDFVDLIISKTTDSVFDEVKKELKNEFDSGVLTHPLFISSEYYLELKFKEIKDNYMKSTMKLENITNNK
jgi:hypothetical protein